MQPQYTQSPPHAAKMLIMAPDENDTAKPRNDAERMPPAHDALEQAFSRSVEIMARLRAPGGCPWDREQTFDSIRRYTLEETYEVLDAIENGNWAGLKDELGDLLLQVLFYAEMAQEAGYFTLRDVLDNLNAKLVRRHPHVFGDAEKTKSAEQVLATWEEIKKSERAENAEREGTSLLDTVPRGLPALMEASKLGSRAAVVGFDWNSAAPVFDKLDEEIQELRAAIATNPAAKNDPRQEEELGDLLFTVVNLARKLGVQAELALRATNGKFRRRFRDMEMADGSAIENLSATELEERWDRAKARERKEPGN
ncbi:MAG: nucleoside triphosphate pyrophosphohydrolase [Acidobacteriaceae bacterium]